MDLKKITFSKFDRFEHLDSVEVCHEYIKIQDEEIENLRGRISRLEEQLADASWQAEHDRYYYESQPKETW